MAFLCALLDLLKAKWSRALYPTKMLVMVLALAVFVGALVYEEDNCGIARVVLQMEPPLKILDKYSPAEIEEREMTEITVDGQEAPMPFGRINHRWQRMKANYRRGDCIYSFRGEPELLMGMAAIEGYVLIRNGELIDAIVIRKS